MRAGLDACVLEEFPLACETHHTPVRAYGVEARDTSGWRTGLEERCGGRGLRVFAARVSAASDLVAIYKDVGAVLMTLSTSSVTLFRLSTSVSSGSAISAIRTSSGCIPFERKIFPPVSSTQGNHRYAFTGRTGSQHHQMCNVSWPG